MNARKLKKPKMFADLAPAPAAPVVVPPLPRKPRTAAKLGSYYMKELGRLGGKANVARHGHLHMINIGRKGGSHPRK